MDKIQAIEKEVQKLLKTSKEKSEAAAELARVHSLRDSYHTIAMELIEASRRTSKEEMSLCEKQVWEMKRELESREQILQDEFNRHQYKFNEQSDALSETIYRYGGKPKHWDDLTNDENYGKIPTAMNYAHEEESVQSSDQQGTDGKGNLSA